MRFEFHGYTFTGDADDKEWYLDAKCLGASTDEMHPEGIAEEREIAKYVCRDYRGECPVQLPCVLDAVRLSVEKGVRGGLTGPQRRKLPFVELIEDYDGQSAELKNQHIQRNNNPRVSLSDSAFDRSA